MSTPSPTRIGDTAEAVLVEVTAALEAAGRTVGRSYIAHGAPAWDLCSADQVSVYLSPLSFKQGSRCGVQLAATLHVQLVRCVPSLDSDGNPPSAIELSTSARGLLDDLGVVTAALLAGAADLFGSCETVTYGQVNPLGPSGGAGGFDWPVTFTL